MAAATFQAPATAVEQKITINSDAFRQKMGEKMAHFLASTPEDALYSARALCAFAQMPFLNGISGIEFAPLEIDGICKIFTLIDELLAHVGDVTVFEN